MNSVDNNLQDKITELLDQGSEYEKLDYKKKVDITQTGECIELIKDIAAMLSTQGGIILIGADSKGVPTTDFTDDLYDKFDESILRSKIVSYVDEPFDISVAMVKKDGHNFAIIEMGQYISGFVILKKTGQYKLQSGIYNYVFREGDVYVRHGSKSEVWKQHDISRIFDEQISKSKAEWLKDVDTIVKHLENKESNKSDVALKRLKELVKITRGKIKADTANISEIQIIVGEVTAYILRAISDNDQSLFYASVKNLNEIYNLAYDEYGSWRQGSQFNPVNLWHEVYIRMPLIIGACLETRNYDFAKFAVLQHVQGRDSSKYENWYRHALTMGSRNNKHRPNHSPLFSTTELYESDDRYKKMLEWDNDDLITFIVRADYFASLIALDDAQRIDSSLFYTAFAYYDKPRVNALVKEIVLDDENRKTIFKSTPQHLAFIMKNIDEVASNVSFIHWYEEWTDSAISKFIDNAQPFTVI